MIKTKKSFTRELASEFRKVNQANTEFADLIRELEYPAVRERIRSPDVPSAFRARPSSKVSFRRRRQATCNGPASSAVCR